MARPLPKKMLLCGSLYQNFRRLKEDDPSRACRIVKKANKRKCKWSQKHGVAKSCKRRY